MYRVFIDGAVGTTGLRIRERLARRPDIELLTIPEEARKDTAARAARINEADLAFLCLPDEASREVAPLVRPDVKLLDTSTAFRTAQGWVYGFPELPGQREKVQASCRVAVPGCYASGFISLVRPAVELGFLAKNAFVSCTGVSGYSGGGKSMIAAYESPERPAAGPLDAPKSYALGLGHKHLPEMQALTGLARAPAFVPLVCDYYSGMQVIVPMALPAGLSPAQVAEGFAQYYANEAQITVHPLGEGAGGLYANARQGHDDLEIYLTANADGAEMLLISLFDNLGKGSSGAALQCMNLMLGCPETEGLE